MKRLTLAAFLLGSAAVPPAEAHDDARRTELFRPGVTHAAVEAPGTAPADIDVTGLDSFGFTSGSDVAEAEEAFRRGVALLWGFNHAAAAEAFRAAQEADPACSLCFWGEGYALGPNLNDGMHPENEARALEAAKTAFALSRTPKERMLAAALRARHDPAVGDRAAQDRAFADAMATAANRLGGEPNVLVIRADALMNLQPWDYWEADGVTPEGKTAEILAVLERAMRIAPDHPAALHLYIHAVEASADPGRAEGAADRLRGAVPMAGHLVHMPAHIYNRVGRFADSVAVNRDAVAADEAYLASAGDGASALYRYGYYPHNLHFLLVAAQMAGLEDDVMEAADKLAGITSEEVSRDLAWVQAILTAPLAAQAQFAAPEAILALPEPEGDFPYVDAHWHYARGTAFALLGDLDAALAEQRAIERILAEADLSGLEAQYLPATTVIEIAKHVVEGRIAQARGDWAEAEHHLEVAIELEDTVAYMEPPYWSYPVRQTLGAMRLQSGDATGALEAFEAALERQPNNGWALWGLWQARKAMGGDQLDEEATAAARDAFRRAWLGEGEPSIERL